MPGNVSRPNRYDHVLNTTYTAEAAETRRDEDGIALIVCTLAMLLMMALGAALVLTTSAETMIAGNFRDAREGRYAAAAGLERAIGDLSAVPDWGPLPGGSLR